MQVPSIIPIGAATLGEWGAFLGSIAAVFGAVSPFIWWFVRRAQNDLVERIDSRYLAMMRENLKSQAAKAGPANTRIIDITFVGPPSHPLRLPVIRDTWLPVLPGVDILGDEFSMTATTYFLRCSGNARIRRHTHSGRETVQVIKGKMIDFISGAIYTPGMVWVIEPGLIHSAVFEAPEDGHGLFLITVEPPLPDSSQTTILLDGMNKLAV